MHLGLASHHLLCQQHLQHHRVELIFLGNLRQFCFLKTVLSGTGGCERGTPLIYPATNTPITCQPGSCPPGYDCLKSTQGAHMQCCSSTTVRIPLNNEYSKYSIECHCPFSSNHRSPPSPAARCTARKYQELLIITRSRPLLMRALTVVLHLPTGTMVLIKGRVAALHLTITRPRRQSVSIFLVYMVLQKAKSFVDPFSSITDPPCPSHQVQVSRFINGQNITRCGMRLIYDMQ